jgi:hypothetical protein
MASTLAACTHNSREVKLLPPTHVQPYFDSKLLEACNLPVLLPERALTQEEVERYWSVDRKNLIICAKRHGYLGDAIRLMEKYDEQMKTANNNNKK